MPLIRWPAEQQGQPQGPRPLAARFANPLVAHVSGDPVGARVYGVPIAYNNISGSQIGVGPGGRFVRPGAPALQYAYPTTLPATPTAATLISIQRFCADSSSESGWHHVQGTGADNSHFLYSGGWYTSTFASTRWLNGVTPAGDVLRPHVAVITARTNDHRAYCNGALAGSDNAAGAVAMDLCDLWGTSSGGSKGFDAEGYGVFIFPFAISETEALEISSSPEAAWRALFEQEEIRVWVPSSGAVSHAASGDLVAGAATVAGTAVHLTLHTATGALAAGSAAVAGTAVHSTLHAASGTLAAGAATVAGTATHLTLHTATGALVADAATVAGSATHSVPGGSHAASGALEAGAATVSGTAAHLTLHAASGALVAGSATVAGTAARAAIHVATGALVADAATVSGECRIGTGPTPAGSRRVAIEAHGRLLVFETPEEAEAWLADQLPRQQKKIKQIAKRIVRVEGVNAFSVKPTAPVIERLKEVSGPPAVQALVNMRAAMLQAKLNAEVKRQLDREKAEREDEEHAVAVMLLLE